ncbi:MAG: hypothetical protein HY785_28015 [Oscillatoriophycideae cyanobacterium NC_groundwater_1537_Pr4_S-0.65um_50_18]|nr:hypothetical protein [Oscillatoriophycideae cyanobacterium NC_groundwater_1537_Pr4_S-0.65um_50_18]
MSASKPLQGLDLIDCAKANAKQGADVATELCGYGTDTAAFYQALKEAGDRMGIQIAELSDLVTEQQTILQEGGIEVAPDTLADL